MQLVLGSDPCGKALKEILKNELLKRNYKIIDITADGQYDFVDAALAVVREVRKTEDSLGIVIDAYGAGPFMTAARLKGIVAAEASDERTAYMTRAHNNARILTIGSLITGEAAALNIVLNFAEGQYEGGRHGIRTDMLAKMGRYTEEAGS